MYQKGHFGQKLVCQCLGGIHLNKQKLWRLEAKGMTLAMSQDAKVTWKFTNSFPHGLQLRLGQQPIYNLVVYTMHMAFSITYNDFIYIPSV